jgi:hypothetical protein
MAAKVQPLLCSGHTRPVTHLQFSNQYVASFSLILSTRCLLVVFTPSRLEDDSFYLISACKDGNPMLRNWLGDWIGSFLGVWPRAVTFLVAKFQRLTTNLEFSAERPQRSGMVIQNLARHFSRCNRQRRLHRVRRILGIPCRQKILLTF